MSAGTNEMAAREGIRERDKRIAELEAELAWYRTLKILRHDDNVTEIDGGEKAQMLHEMWEENVRLKKELSERGISPKETADLFGGEMMNVARQGEELLRRGKKIESLKAERDTQEQSLSDEIDLRLETIEERDKLRDILNDYGDHTPGCYMRNAPNEPRGCNCGWDVEKREVLGHD